MKLTILGSGTMMPTKTRRPAGYLLVADDTKILLDCGHTTLARLVELGVNLHDIDCVAMTHFHTDHFSDCFPLVHARWVDDTQAGQSHMPLTIIGPQTIKERYQKWREIFWPEPKEEYPIKFLEPVDKMPLAHKLAITINKLTINSFPIHHVPWFPSIGYKIEHNSKTLVYTGDLGPNQGQAFYEAIRAVDCLLIEAGGLAPAPNHLTAEQVLELANKYKVRKAIITHVREQNLDAIDKVIKNSAGLLHLAHDGDTFKI